MGSSYDPRLRRSQFYMWELLVRHYVVAVSEGIQVPPRFELGSLDSESRVLTITPWDLLLRLGESSSFKAQMFTSTTGYLIPRKNSCFYAFYIFTNGFYFYEEMKTRFSTYDLICSVTELQKYVGLRVNQVYDIDHKTYLIRLQKTDEKIVILLESGTRIHTTDFEWPKNVAPSGFSMKLRKHLRNKRLESLKQLGFDRIVDLQFGTGSAAYHIFLELYDRGNIILTDCDLVILNILRPHTEGDKIRFAVREKYPTDRARENCSPPSEEELKILLESAKPGDNLKKILNPNLEYGPAVLEHVLLGVSIQGNNKIGQEFNINEDLPNLVNALKEAEKMMIDAKTQVSKGYIIKKVEKRPTENGVLEDFHINQEFHPFLFRQHTECTYTETETFLKAVDSFYSSVESQKIDMKAISQEKEALKKLENVKKDHDQRLQQLLKTQELDKVKAELITANLTLVDQAILAVRTAIANQMAWTDIESLVKQGKAMGDPIASYIKKLKLDINHITLQLSDPYSDYSDDEKNEDDIKNKKQNYMDVDIDLDLTAFANARKYYDQKRSAAKKQQKTIESQDKALKSAEKKTKRTLKEMKAIVNISKVRKTLWFEKFFWFISSENYLVIGGRDMTQNELIVKRYMKAGDIYVHAEIQGASSVVIKNPTGEPVPPKTLNEAGVMAICYSVAWDAKVVTAAWWVHSEQVSKTAPTGEYLRAGSFMIRGKKNYLPPGNLILGFSFLFKLEDTSVFRHKDERKVKALEDTKAATTVPEEEEVEIILSDGGENDDEDDEEEKKLKENGEMPTIIEEETKEDSNENTTCFPDTEIKIRHTGRQISLETKPAEEKKEEEEETILYLGDQKPVTVKANHQKKKEKDKSNGKGGGKGKKEEDSRESSPKKEEGNGKEDGKLKRGQRGKLKKIKDKYKDQDEEDRQLRLEILQNVVTKKTVKREKANIKEAAKKAEKNESLNKKKIERQPKTADNEDGNDSEEEVQEPVVCTDLDMLSSLTGIPLPEDELLFAVPVVAPYNTLQNYKYKVKLTPGTGKRGKAAKTAVDIFLKDKTCSQREKDLLKSVKFEDLARNLPGKVKVSAPHLHKK